MNRSQLDQALQLMRRTGDRLLVMDSASEEVTVLLPIAEYEHLLDQSEPWHELTEEEMLERVNREIAEWREHHDNDTETGDDLFEGEDEDDEDLAEFDENEAFGEEFQLTPDRKEKQNSSSTSSATASGAKADKTLSWDEQPETKVVPMPPAQGEQEEQLSDIPEDEEEEKFYLEPLEGNGQ